MLVRTALFYDNDFNHDLAHKINDFIAERNIKVIDIKFSTTSNMHGAVRYQALLIYDTDTK